MKKQLQENLQLQSYDEAKLLSAMLAQFKVEFEKFVAKEKNLILAGGKTKYAYILDQSLQVEILKTFSLLESKEWIVAQSPSVGGVSCQSILGQ